MMAQRELFQAIHNGYLSSLKFREGVYDSAKRTISSNHNTFIVLYSQYVKERVHFGMALQS